MVSGKQILAAGLMSAFGLTVSTGVLAVVVNFEGFSDGALLVSEVPGLTFSGGTVLSAGIGLNELDYPPTSGSNVLAALSGPLSLDFGAPTAVSAYMVVGEQLSISAFDEFDQLLATHNTPFAANLGAPQLFDFSWAGASRYSLQSTQAFVIDDLNFAAVPAIPEPSTFALSATSLTVLVWILRRRRGSIANTAVSR
jgi:hypothetical protein